MVCLFAGLGLVPVVAEACTGPEVLAELARIDAALANAKISPNTRERVLTMRARADYLHLRGLDKAASMALDGPMHDLGLARAKAPDGRTCR